MRTTLPAITPLIRLVMTGLILCGLSFTPMAAPALDQTGKSPGEMEIITETVAPEVFNGDVRDLPVSKTWQPGDPITEIPRRVYPRRQTSPQPAPGSDSAHRDPLLDVQGSAQSEGPGRAFFPPDLNFAGMGFSGAFPPDTVGDVGPNHYVQMINGTSGAMVQIFDKTTGASLAGPFNLETLIVGGVCAAGAGDPIVLYDRAADRWLLSELASGTNNLCVYISQTPSPITGGWFRYTFNTPNFLDYPKYGVWPDAYYVSTNESGPSAAYALERTTMLTGGVARMVRLTAPDLAGFGFQALIPSDLDGPTAPPVGSPNFFMRHRDDEVHNVGANDPTRDFVEVWEFRVNFAGGSTLTGPTNIPVAEFSSDLCGLVSFNCFPQPGTTTTLDPLREVIMWRLQYQNFGTHETLVGNFVTDVDGTDHGGIRWFELRRTPPGSGAWTLFQQGTHSPDAAHRWMGSIAMDKHRNIALGYSTSSSTVFPSIRYAGRLASDTLGTLQAENSLQAGVSFQTGTDRWGDYAAMSVDPSDDCTFWFTTEYIPAAGSNWATRIGKFKFPICGVTDLLSLSKADSPDPVIVNQNLTYTLTVNNPSAAPATGVTLTDTLPSGVTFVSASSTQGTCSQASGTVTCNLGTVAGGATVTVTIVIQPAQIGTLNNSATVTATENDPNTSNNTAAATTGVVPNLLGSYSGSSTSGNTETVTNCIDPTSNGVFQFNSSITISTQTGGNFTGTGTLTGVGSFQGTTINVTNAAGTIGSSGAITGGTFNYSIVRGGMTVESGTGTFTGTATASPTVSQLVFNFSSQSTSGTGCRATGTVTGTPAAAGGGGGGGGCFIATAAFGSPLAAEVQVLRAFRDKELLTHAPGRAAVAVYYRLSPPLARLIASNAALRSATGITLRPVIWWAGLALESPGLAWSLLVLGAGSLVVVVITPFLPFRARRPGAKQPLKPSREV